MKTFTKELTWMTYEPGEKPGDVKEVFKTKIATFKELNRTDKTQHKLHFKIMSILQGSKEENSEENKEEKGEININTDVLYDITAKSVKQLLVCDNDFTEMDKNELLNDSIALLEFGGWLLGEKFTPFFVQLKMN